MTAAIGAAPRQPAAKWEFMRPNHGNRGFPEQPWTAMSVFMREGPTGEGLAAGQRTLRILDALLVPSDPRGIVLLCGFIACAAFGLGAVVTPPSDPIGWAYIAGAVLGYFYIQTRGLTTFLWLLVAADGVAVGMAGAASGWVVMALGLALASVSLLPLPLRYRDPQPPSTAVVTLPSQAQPGARLNGVSEAIAAGPSAPVHDTESALVIVSIGAFRLSGAAGDLTASLEAKSVISFIWKLLLAREVQGEPPLARESLGDELSPRISDSNKRERVRKQIYDLQNDLPQELASVVRTNRTQLWLDLSGADCDASSLKKLTQRIASNGSLIDSAQAAEVRATLAVTAGEFLPGFDELQNRVTQGSGTAGEMVSAARALIANQRADLTRALAAYLDASGQAQDSIPHLKAALEVVPERQDLARLLMSAYLQTGQPARATEVRRTFDLNQE